eukprot:scaffold803_cov310-Pinguiococcus_pyrenoidosus.AAC.143
MRPAKLVPAQLILWGVLVALVYAHPSQGYAVLCKNAVHSASTDVHSQICARNLTHNIICGAIAGLCHVDYVRLDNPIHFLMVAEQRAPWWDGRDRALSMPSPLEGTICLLIAAAGECCDRLRACAST